ncbi:MAG TPA: helix-turn-helix domain-containing protein [Tepidisphaeraceae bacterium]|jgi:DNA-binding HxlR family transcriptional regulator|nr:helix-turn-helix domain-containing protein [Tepidisphaeraceae bacterium]
MSDRVSFDEGADSATNIVCSLDRAIRVIGGKWKMLILRSLFVVGAQRYNSFLRTVPGISPKELTRNLRELEHAGLVTRTKCENGPADIDVYALTELGSNLHPAFKALGSFGELLARKRVGGSN